jgi:hypothetical protein
MGPQSKDRGKLGASSLLKNRLTVMLVYEEPTPFCW